MLTERLLDRTPVLLLYAGTALLLFAASEIGFRIAVWHATRSPPGDRAPTNAIMGSTLGLLAFMLASTFGASSARFDAKRQLVLDEARSCWSSRTWSGRGRDCSPSRRSRSWTWPAASPRLLLLRNSDRRLA
jgi:hypothetical protein